MKHGNFFMVQNQIFDFALSPVCVVVYCYLCKCRNKKNGCYPSKRTIAKACGIAVSSVSKAIKQLASAGLIVITANYSGSRQINNSYQFADLPVCQTDAPIGHGGISPVSQMDRSKQEELGTAHNNKASSTENKKSGHFSQTGRVEHCAG